MKTRILLISIFIALSAGLSQAQVFLDTCNIDKAILLNKVHGTTSDTTLITEYEKEVVPDSAGNPFYNLPAGTGANDLPTIVVYRAKTDPGQNDTSYFVSSCDATYEIVVQDSLPSDANRPIYFLHGLGGKADSWQGASNYAKATYKYTSYRPEYNFATHTNQRHFLNTSGVVHEEIGNAQLNFEIDSRYYNLPFVIAHSQGGLVSRDLDMKYYTIKTQDPNLQGKRRFHGVVTVGTPHDGAKIAISQDDVTKLGLDLANKVVSAEAALKLADLDLKWYIKVFTNTETLITLASALVDTLQAKLEPTILKLASEGKADDITKQYSPTATYLQDTLNKFINPCLNKALFYGVEQRDHQLWRMGTYMLKNVQEYGDFGANNDDTMALAMEDIRLKLVARGLQAGKNVRIARSMLVNCRGYYGFVSKIACKGRKSTYDEWVNISTLVNDAHQFMGRADVLFKTILGSVGDDVYKDSLIHYVTREPLIGPRQIMKPDTAPALIDAAKWEPVYKRVWIEYDSDATVLQKSQMHWPGVPPQYKHEMKDANGVGNINHMQERNSNATREMLKMIYNADDIDIPEFFILEQW